ncbi:MAG TPA: dUTP diphosphatase, partial [Solirubrobacteraceae bacterium]
RVRSGDAAYDLRCVEGFTLAPGERRLVPTGIAVALPAGCCGLVLPRSGLAARHGVGVVNGPGLIDPNYRGEVKVVLINHSAEEFSADAGDRIAQLLVVPFAAPPVEVVSELSATERGEGGFGSSGR